jgi:hypothetical protein
MFLQHLISSFFMAGLCVAGLLAQQARSQALRLLLEAGPSSSLETWRHPKEPGPALLPGSNWQLAQGRDPVRRGLFSERLINGWVGPGAGS